MKDRICLIISPSPFLADARVFVSLGILKVAAVLEQAGYPVDVLDLSGVENYLEVVENYFLRSDAKFAGITMTTPQAPSAEKICQTIKDVSPGVRTICGGPHVTVVNAAKKLEAKKGMVGRAHRAFTRIANMTDVLVAGDGEEAIFVALRENCPKFVDADDPDSDLFLQPYRLKTLPFPARHFIDLESYHYYVGGQRASSLIMQLGCPFGCRFCSGRLSPSFRKTRIRDINNVLNEIEYIYKDYGYKGYMMYDDELNVNPNIIQDMRALMFLQEKLGVQFSFRGFIKADLFNEAQAKVMKEAGFVEICVGFESGSPRILKNIKKRATIEQNTSCLEIAKKYGLRLKAFTSVGHPGESQETIKQTCDWLISSQVDDFDITILSVLPGTTYYDEAIPLDSKEKLWVYTAPETGDRVYAQDIDYVSTEDYYKGQIDDGYRAYVHTDHLSAGELVILRDWVEREVRNKLNISFYQTVPAILYDHSMGCMPTYILRRSEPL